MFRVYFNRELEWPQCWSVDNGDQSTEINVCGFSIDGCTVQSRQLSPEQRVQKRLERLNHPFAWMEILEAVMVIRDGRAIFSPL